MASVSESSQPDSDAEEDYLISHEYEDEKDRRTDELHYSRRRIWIPATTSSLVTIVVVTALLSMLLSGFALYFLHLLRPQQSSGIAHPQPGTRFGFCGDTPSSARQANCTFDLMSFSWLPPACAETELTTEFLRLRNWTWWIDAEKNNPVPLHEVLKGEYRELYVTREYHMYHCTYMWRKLHRGLLRGQGSVEERGVVDTYIGAYWHTAHCEMMLLGMEGDEGGIDKMATDTIITMKFPQCMWI
jgi:hypothetical protein